MKPNRLFRRLQRLVPVARSRSPELPERLCRGPLVVTEQRIVALSSTRLHMLSRRTALWALAVIFLVNFLNYTDRQLVSALEKQLHDEPALQIGETEFGLLWTLIIVGYMVCAVPIGLLADRIHRPRLFALCIVIWSLATVASGMAQTRTILYVARMFIGVGEAGCLVIGPALLSDLFSLKARSKALSIFYLGMPLGGVMAYLMVAVLHNDLPWRSLFYLAGCVGLLGMLSMHRSTRKLTETLIKPRQDGTFAKISCPHPDLYALVDAFNALVEHAERSIARAELRVKELDIQLRVATAERSSIDADLVGRAPALARG